MIKLLIDEQEVKFTTTIFPDGTSQVWKLEQLPVSCLSDGDEEAKILWLFENEAELIHIVQLAELVQQEYNLEDITLVAPYLPYGRQDKEVSNQTSFALSTIKSILYNANICRIETFDAHSQSDMIYSISPRLFHKSVTNHDIICCPDAGAAERYKYNFELEKHNHICFEKVRNQLTGEITGLKLLGSNNIKGRSILIVDDICDGGMTFIKVVEALKEYKPSSVDLAVSHGLFSRGKQILYDAGISNIYTTNSLLRNPEGFKVW